LDKTSEDKQQQHPIQQSSSIDSQQLYFDEQGLKLKDELRIEEEKIEKMKKTKRALAAKQRLLIKRQQSQQQEGIGGGGGGSGGGGGACSSTTTIPSSPQLSSEELTALPLPPRRGTCDLVEVEANLLATKTCIQEQQKLVDAGRQKLKMYLGECITPHIDTPYIEWLHISSANPIRKKFANHPVRKNPVRKLNPQKFWVILRFVYPALCAPLFSLPFFHFSSLFSLIFHEASIYLPFFSRIKKRNMIPKIIINLRNITKSFSPQKFRKIFTEIHASIEIVVA